MPEPQLHEQQCFACWLDALGVDRRLADSLLTAAFTVGWSEAVATLGAPPGLLRPLYANPGRAVSIERLTRERMAAPLSPEVQAAMNGGHHHG